MLSLFVSLFFLIFGAVSLFYLPFHIALLLINVFTFISFGYDKVQAKALAGTSRGGAYFRTSESMLLFMCIAGGWIGGASAMVIFNHKLRKATFLIMYIVAAVVNVGVTLYISGF